MTSIFSLEPETRGRNTETITDPFLGRTIPANSQFTVTGYRGPYKGEMMVEVRFDLHPHTRLILVRGQYELEQL
jgi:hypothetical protein